MTVSIERIDNKDTILRFLSQDRLYAAYAIADLEPSFFRLCEWYAASRFGELSTLCLRFKGLRPDRIFVMGSAEDLVPILGGVLKPKRSHFAARAGHMSVIGEFYLLERIEEMSRMVLEPGDFTPVEGPVVRLGARHVHQLQELYRAGGDVAFAPYQLDRGVFYGVERDEKLVASAGTHLVSRVHGLGIVGNVFTHHDYRGRGYATMCTSAVVEELLSQSLDVVLSVGQGNTQADRTYRRLGFRTYCSFVEAFGTRKGKSRKGAAV